MVQGGRGDDQRTASAVRALDPILEQAYADGRTSLELPLDTYSVTPVLEWDEDNTRRMPPHEFTLNGQGSTVYLDTERVTDEMLRVQAPLHVLTSAVRWARGKSGSDLIKAIPSGQAVKNLKIVGQHSKLSERAKGLGVSLRITAVCLQGSNTTIDSVQAVDFGAHGYEAFPFVITGVLDGLDRHAFSAVDPGFMFGPATISNTDFSGYVPDASNNQVTVNMIVGGTCPGQITTSPWQELAPWRQIMRQRAEIRDCKASATGKNIVQGFTVYQAIRGLIDGCSTDGAAIGVYGDYYSTKGLHVTPNNSFMGGDWGAVFRLSPTTANVSGLAEQFSHEDYVIGKFQCNAREGDVYLNADPMPDGSQPTTRFIRNIAVDERLRVGNEGNRAGVVLIPGPHTKKRGCFQ